MPIRTTIRRESKETPPKKKVPLGAAGMSFLMHAALFLTVGTVVVTQYAVPPSPMTGDLTPSVVSDDVPPPETPEPMEQPETPEVPVELKKSPAPAAPAELNAAPLDVMTVSTLNTNFQVPVFSAGTGDVSNDKGVGPGGGQPPGKSDNIGKPITRDPFGAEKPPADSSLTGFLYDLKQTRNGKPANPDGKYVEILMEFFKKNWNPRVLDDYYQVKSPRYATQIFMPLMQASEAPKAFQVENEVKPSRWVILYQGAFQAPVSGQYRFAGYADDVLVVRINDKTILDGSRRTAGFDGDFTEPLVKVSGQEVRKDHKFSGGCMVYSNWLNLEAGQANKIEILVGENPGGGFCAFLFVEQKGKEYQKEANGRPILPIFRLADTDTDPVSEAKFEKDGPVFGSK